MTQTNIIIDRGGGGAVAERLVSAKHVATLQAIDKGLELATSSLEDEDAPKSKRNDGGGGARKSALGSEGSLKSSSFHAMPPPPPPLLKAAGTGLSSTESNSSKKIATARRNELVSVLQEASQVADSIEKLCPELLTTTDSEAAAAVDYGYGEMPATTLKRDDYKPSTPQPPARKRMRYQRRNSFVIHRSKHGSLGLLAAIPPPPCGSRIASDSGIFGLPDCESRLIIKGMHKTWGKAAAAESTGSTE